jgi:alkanesulfonate monooxygenase SsuD/methylene tetrahydromethanopterin reductase-like flavin-dependent oxidoreductase (luciferase family)
MPGVRPTRSPTVFGVHTGPSNTTVEELRSLWRRVEDGPYDWISIWDHLAAADGVSTANFEAVALHAALALTTARVRVGCLVYCASYRHPSVIAKAVTTIDHLSGGRCEVGLGAGWAQFEYDAYGFDWHGAPQRLDVLDEAAACIRSLLHHDRTSFEGRHFRLVDAANDPRPLQERMPVWIGGGGERRTLRIVAERADGWNVPFVSPEVFAAKSRVLDGHCEEIGRDPTEIRRSVNVGCAPDEASLERQFGHTAPFVRPGVLTGSTSEMVDRLGAYIDAGAHQINLALRAPFELAALDHLTEAIGSL